MYFMCFTTSMKKCLLPFAALALLLACNPERVDTVKNPVPDGAVDLGLSVYWGTCNIGANAPEEYGDYYAWGEISTKHDCSWETYKWGNYEESHEFSRYNGKDYSVLLPEDDIATSLGGICCNFTLCRETKSFFYTNISRI